MCTRKASTTSRVTGKPGRGFTSPVKGKPRGQVGKGFGRLERVGGADGLHMADVMGHLIRDNPAALREVLNLPLAGGHKGLLQLTPKEFRRTGMQQEVCVEGTCADTFHARHLKKFAAMNLNLPEFSRWMQRTDPSTVRAFLNIVQRSNSHKLAAVAEAARKRRKGGRVWNRFVTLFREL